VVLFLGLGVYHAGDFAPGALNAKLVFTPHAGQHIHMPFAFAMNNHHDYVANN
jgi:hypothetical protein